jgi:hypothetical protein
MILFPEWVVWAKKKYEWIYASGANDTLWSLPDNHVKIRTKIMGMVIKAELKRGRESLGEDFVNEVEDLQVCASKVEQGIINAYNLSKRNCHMEDTIDLACSSDEEEYGEASQDGEGEEEDLGREGKEDEYVDRWDSVELKGRQVRLFVGCLVNFMD